MQIFIETPLDNYHRVLVSILVTIRLEQRPFFFFFSASGCDAANGRAGFAGVRMSGGLGFENVEII